jgi:hypothetical protein
VRSGGLDLLADRARGLPVVDPQDRALVMSCGAALFTLRVALRRFGCRDVVTPFPDPHDPDLLARVTLDGTHQTTDEEIALFMAIPKRRTSRLPFDGRKPPEALLLGLQTAAVREGAWLHVFEALDRDVLADLIAEGDRLQMADRHFRRELAAWMTPNRSRSRDGIPGYALGMGDLMSAAGPLVIRTFDLGTGRAAKDRELALGSPALAAVGTVGDAPRDWLAAGQAVQHVLLRAWIDGLAASFLNQPVEVPELRQRLQVLTGYQGFPQLILRFGFGGQGAKPTPRRPVADVLVD